MGVVPTSFCISCYCLLVLVVYNNHINRTDVGVKQMINKFHTVNAAKWVECDSDEYNDRVCQLF